MRTHPQRHGEPYQLSSASFGHAIFRHDHADFVAQANQGRRQRAQYVRQAAGFGEGSGLRRHHQDLHCAAAPNRCFCTLPSALRGSLSTTINRRGHLKEAKFFAADGLRERPYHKTTTRNHIGHGDFAAHAIGLGRHRRFGDLRLFHEELFDLARIDVEAARDNQVAAAAAQGVVAVGRSLRDVAGLEPAIDERGARGIVTPPVSGEHVRTFQIQLAGFAVGHFLAVFD